MISRNIALIKCKKVKEWKHDPKFQMSELPAIYEITEKISSETFLRGIGLEQIWKIPFWEEKSSSSFSIRNQRRNETIMAEQGPAGIKRRNQKIRWKSIGSGSKNGWSGKNILMPSNWKRTWRGTWKITKNKNKENNNNDNNKPKQTTTKKRGFFRYINKNSLVARLPMPLISLKLLVRVRGPRKQNLSCCRSRGCPRLLNETECIQVHGIRQPASEGHEELADVVANRSYLKSYGCKVMFLWLEKGFNDPIYKKVRKKDRENYRLVSLTLVPGKISSWKQH